MKKSVKILLIVLAVSLTAVPEARAIDPVTLAILLPIAVQVAQAAKPYLLRAGVNTCKQMLKIGKDTVEIFYLFYGMGKICFSSADGSMHSGLVYMIRGCIAPCKMIFHILILPVYMIGIEMNV